MNAHAALATARPSPIRYLADLHRRVANANEETFKTCSDADARSAADRRSNELMLNIDRVLLYSPPTNTADAATLLSRASDYSQIIFDEIEEERVGDLAVAVFTAIDHVSSFLGTVTDGPAGEGKAETVVAASTWKQAVEDWERVRRSYGAVAADTVMKDDFYAMQDIVLDLPAPDFPALIYKIKQVSARIDDFVAAPDGIFERIVSDIRRLVGIPDIDRADWENAVSAYWIASNHHQTVSDDDASEADALKAVDAAIARLLATPAPDEAALATKIDLIDREGLQAMDEAFQSILADARRLGGR